jgi:hypothetical protein
MVLLFFLEDIERKNRSTNESVGGKKQKINDYFCISLVSF